MNHALTASYEPNEQYLLVVSLQVSFYFDNVKQLFQCCKLQHIMLILPHGFLYIGSCTRTLLDTFFLHCTIRCKQYEGTPFALYCHAKCTVDMSLRPITFTTTCTKCTKRTTKLLVLVFEVQIFTC